MIGKREEDEEREVGSIRQLLVDWLISEASRQTWAVDTVIAEVRPEDYAHLYEKDS